MSTLVIVESPAKAKTIEKYLGKGHTVLASVGHVRDLPKSNKDAVDIEGGFIPNYITVPGKSRIISDIKKATAKADIVLLATDPDREGEAIAWHVAQVAGLKNAQRIVFNEITQEAVNEAVKHPRAIDENLKEAQEARRVLDRLVGYDLSGLIWKKVRYGLSAGRVQSPALRIIMEREREIRAFIPEDFWVLTATLSQSKGLAFKTTCVEEPRDKKEVERIVAEAKKGTWYVKSNTENEVRRSPRPPFTTSTLQQTASTRLGFSPSRTMRAAQKLYEAGAITYMRTDSTTLAKSALMQIANLVEKEYGETYKQVRTYQTKSKNAQEAHEAVRPTNPHVKNAGADEDQKKLYALIWARTIASQMTEAQLIRSKVTVNIQSNTIPDFSVTGSRVMFDGWLKADPVARGEDTSVPAVREGDSLTLKNIEDEAKQTQPPNRYSEAGLIKELEKRGIGRPSTYASIMKTIIDRGYVEKEGRTLIPTATGDVVSTFLEAHFADYISDSFTAEMEDELDQIARGARTYEKTLREFYTPFSKALSAKEHIPKLTMLGVAPKEFPCPLCNAPMEYKLSKNGVFMSCSRFPECSGARSEKGDVLGGEESIGNHPELGKPIYIRNGRFGPYVEMVLEEAKETTTKTGKSKKLKPITKRASIPKNLNPDEITLEEAVHLLVLPRNLGEHPETGLMVSAGTGQYGPFVVHDTDFRSLKTYAEKNETLDPYTISLERALQIFKEPKKGRKGIEVARVIGLHPRTKKPITLYKSKRGYFLKKGLKHIVLDRKYDPEKITPEKALEILKNA